MVGRRRMREEPVMQGTVLLCDDEVHVVRTIGVKLQRAGYAVITAADGEEAWDLICRERPGLLITDLFMPRMDGLQLCQRMRDTASTREVPIFLITGRGLEFSHAELVDKWNVLDIISKPFSPRDVVCRVNRVLGIRPEVSSRSGLQGACALRSD